MREAAGRDHHTAARGNRTIARAMPYDHANDAIALHRQIFDICAEEDLDLPRQQ